jgi:hypothetical protein
MEIADPNHNGGSTPARPPAEDEPRLQELRTLLAQFLHANPAATVAIGSVGPQILTPWNDRSVSIAIDTDDSALLQALNSLILPAAFSAVRHADTHDMEFIWGPVTLSSPYALRHFDFLYKGATYVCEFAPASERLRLLANATIPVSSPTLTQYRNLQSMGRFLTTENSLPGMRKDLVLTSFWIHNITLDELELVKLARSLNFCMSYFDERSPRVLIHEANAELNRAPSQSTVREEFPSHLVAGELDEFLMTLWESATDSADVFRRFINYYQILEYSAFYFLDKSLQVGVRKVLRQPDALGEIDRTVHALLDVLAENKRQDETRIVELVSTVVDPGQLWACLAPHEKYFSEALVFDGGFELPPLIKPGWTVEEWCCSWSPAYPNALRKIRNALVHGREQRSALVIAPTNVNLNRLRHWLPGLRSAAGQVILYVS